MKTKVYIGGKLVCDADVTIIHGEEKYERVVTISPPQTISIPRGKDPDIVVLSNLQPPVHITLGSVIDLMLEDGKRRQVMLTKRMNGVLSGTCID